MIEAILERTLCVGGAAGPIHRLKKEMPEAEGLKLLWISSSLRIYQLQFVAATLHQLRSDFGADTNPIQSSRSFDRPIGFDGNFEIAKVQRFNQACIHLQQGLPTCANYEALPQR